MRCGCSRLRTFCNFGLKFPLSQLLETKLPLSSLQIMTAYLWGFIQNSYCILNSPPASIQAKAGARQASITTGQSKIGPPGLSELSPSSTLEMAKFCWHSAVPWIRACGGTMVGKSWGYACQQIHKSVQEGDTDLHTNLISFCTKNFTSPIWD